MQRAGRLLFTLQAVCLAVLHTLAVLQGDTQQAEHFLKQAVQEAIQGFGAEDPHVAAAENNLAELYRLLGEHNRAEQLYLSVRGPCCKIHRPG